MVSFVEDKSIIRIAVTRSAKGVIETWARENDMTEIGVASRIYEWFGQQPEVVQRGVLGLFGSYGPAITRMVMEQQAGRDDAAGSKDNKSRDAPPGRRGRKAS